MGMIRFLLAAAVVIVHSAPLFGKIGSGGSWEIGVNGDMSVTSFFIISGFLIAMILEEGYSSVQSFYLTRGVRIYAPYVLALLLALAVHTAGIQPSYDFGEAVGAAAETGNVAALLYFLVANGTIFGTETALLLASNPDFSGAFLVPSHSVAQERDLVSWLNLLIVPQAWTLSMELQFYLLAPLLCRLKPGTLGLITLGLFFSQESLYNFLIDSDIRIHTAGSIVFQLHFFLFGALAFQFYREADLGRLDTWPRLAMAWAMVFLSFFLVFKGYALQRADFITWELFYILFAFTVPFLFAVFRRMTWDRFVGELSYPIYLFHFALVPLMRDYFSDFYLGLAVLTASTLLALAYLFTLHGPVERWRRSLGARSYQSIHQPAE